MTVRLVNLTPHALVVVGSAGPYARREPDGPPARVAEMRSAPEELATDLGPLPLVTLAYADDVEGLPNPEPDVRYVVSRVTAAALAAQRDDLLFPLDEVREAGVIVGCRALGRFETPDDAGEPLPDAAGARPGDTSEG